MHLWLGQAARHDAQDQTSWPSQRRYRLHAQSDRLQSDPHSQTAGGVGQRPLTTSRPPQNPKAKKTSNAPISRFFSRLLEVLLEVPEVIRPKVKTTKIRLCRSRSMSRIWSLMR